MTLRRKLHCEFAIAVSREICSSNMLNKIANHAYKARANRLNHFHGSWEFEGYKVESQNHQLRLTWNLM